MASIDQLLEIMATLRDPEDGCPWDREQDFASISPYTIEEAYEVDDAIRRGDLVGLKDELGDLLLQVVFQARIAEEAGHFSFDGVVASVCDKMVRRHPHVFADAVVEDAAAQSANWEAIKAAERRAQGDAGSALDTVPLALPALVRAAKLQRRIRRAGLAAPEPANDTIGGRLFALVREANEASVDPEQALRDVTEQFLAAARMD